MTCIQRLEERLSEVVSNMGSIDTNKGDIDKRNAMLEFIFLCHNMTVLEDESLNSPADVGWEHAT